MPIKQFTTDFQELGKISSLFLTTRIKKYQIKQKSDYLPFSYFIDSKNIYTLGQIKREDYQYEGKFPIIDQGQDFTSGYSDDEDLVYTGKLPAVIFGDHTRIFKFVDFPFIQGADGIKVIKPNENIVDPKFFYYLLLKIGVPSRGYNRHFSILKKQKYPLILKSTQDEIVTLIEPIEKKIKELKNQIKPKQEIINKVLAREFGFDENLYNEFGKGMTAGTQIAEARKLRIFETKFKELSISNILRFSTRFHNTPTKKLMNFLDSVETIKVKNIVKSYEKGIQPKYNPDGEIPVVKIANLKNFYINFSETENITRADFDKINIKKKLRKNDVIVCATGKISLEKIDFFDSENEAITSVDNYILRLKENYNSLFFTYFFRSILGYFQIERDYTGATNQIHLYWEQISNFKIPNISLPKQQKIVDEIKAELDKQEEMKQKIVAERAKIDEIIEKAII